MSTKATIALMLGLLFWALVGLMIVVIVQFPKEFSLVVSASAATCVLLVAFALTVIGIRIALGSTDERY